MAHVFSGVKGAGVLDLVAAWYVLAAKYIQDTTIRCALVSTNSITQGEQVGVLWSDLYRLGIHIQFAHRTFKWSNEARGKAAVHCVIVGFGLEKAAIPTLHDYFRPDAEPQHIDAKQINPYLVDAPETFLVKRGTPVSITAPFVNYGSMPIDEGHLILTDEEYDAAVIFEPDIKKWVRRYYGGDEFLNGTRRWCLWLVDAPPEAIKNSSFIRGRVEACRRFRDSSGRATTRELAKTPALFGEIRQPNDAYLLIPKVSSEGRAYIPCGFLGAESIASGSCLIVPGATLFHFGVVTSTMHMAWMRSVAGRMKSDYQYSAGVVYNNFPWPELANAGTASKQELDSGLRRNDEQKIEVAAQGVLDARAQFPDSTLADLYDPLTMPPALAKAHQTLDRAVDAAYVAAEKAAGRKVPKLATDAERVAFLFERYQALTSLLPDAKAKGRRGKASSGG
jgi:hypothetical protein